MAENECNCRFVSVSEEEIATLLCDKCSVNTKTAIKVSVGVLELTYVVSYSAPSLRFEAGYSWQAPFH